MSLIYTKINNKKEKIKSTLRQVMNFDSIKFISISKVYEKPKTCKEVDYQCQIHLKGNSSPRLFYAGWVNVQNSHDYGFHRFIESWKSYKSGNIKQKIKWDFKSKCTSDYTILYVFDYSIIKQIHTYSSNTRVKTK